MPEKKLINEITIRLSDDQIEGLEECINKTPLAPKPATMARALLTRAMVAYLREEWTVEDLNRVESLPAAATFPPLRRVK